MGWKCCVPGCRSGYADAPPAPASSSIHKFCSKVSKFIRFQQTLQHILQNKRSLTPSMLGASRMEGSLWFLASLMRNTLWMINVISKYLVQVEIFYDCALQRMKFLKVGKFTTMLLNI